MQVAEDTKQRIIEKLNNVPPDKLGSILDYVEFVAMDPVSRSLRGCAVDSESLRDDALALIEEAMNEARPGVSDEQVRQELGL